MNRSFLSCLAGALALALPLTAHANTVTITGDPSAPTGNFGTGGNTATYGYTITLSDDGTSVIAVLTTALSTPFDFTNLYFDSWVESPTELGSTIGFETSGTAVNDAFIPGVNGSNTSLASLTGFSAVETFTANDKTITVTLPNTFFLDDPLNMGFVKTPEGDEISLHISQSFGFSAVGQSTAFPLPDELGVAEITEPPVASPVPEPAGLDYMAISGIVAALGASRRAMQRLRA
jgi:hypothetical protein